MIGITGFTADLRSDFRQMLPLASKESKATVQVDPPVLFKLYSPGVLTARDEWVYGFSAEEVKRNVTHLTRNYSLELSRRQVEEQGKGVDDFVNRESTFIKWTDRLKEALVDGTRISFNKANTRCAIFRPFTSKFLYFDHLLNQRRYQQHRFFPGAEAENKLLWTKVPGDWSFFALATDRIPDYLPQGGSQCFPFYTYAEDGTHRRENITDWALEQFRAHYHDSSITKWDIFHYIYAVLHHPDYRERYAANLRRELPRIPWASALSASSALKDLEVFSALAKAGQHLAEIHVHYEQQLEYKLTKVEKKGEKLDYRVTKMKLSKDKTTLIYNEFLTLSGIPKETYDYRLGNRSALENGSSINIRSQPTSAAASPTIQIATTTRNIFCD